MKLGIKAQNPLEWVALQTGLIPQPVLLAHFGFIISKVVGEALKTGLLESIADREETAARIADKCQLNEKAVTAMLQALVGLQLVKYHGKKFSLAADSKKWLLEKSKQPYAAQLLFDSEVCYSWMNNMSNFLQTGQGLQYHNSLQPKEWQLYQNGMAATSQMLSKLAAHKITIPSGSTTLLDIGGAHGLYSMALLQKHSQLTAEVIDLPEAIAIHTKQQTAYPDRLSYTAGNILEDTLPKEKYNIVLMANVAHHFSEEQNVLVAQKVLAALKPGGSFYILEFFQKDMAASANDMIGSLQSFFFFFSSTSGLWPSSTIKSWFRKANFEQIRVKSFLQFPGFGLVTGKKG